MLSGYDGEIKKISNNEMIPQQKVWVEGVHYDAKGGNLLILSQPFDVLELNKRTNIVNVVTYQKQFHRVWEHKYTAGGMKEKISYWDVKSGSWYTFNRSGDYYVYKWVQTIHKV